MNFFWFRRDLRLADNCGLFHALQGDLPVIPLFIFDTEILDKLPKDDARVTFIHRKIVELDQNLRGKKRSFLIMHGKPLEVFQELTSKFMINTVFTNRDYEPYAIDRDKNVEAFLQKKDIQFKTFKDQVIFEKDEVVKKDGSPYTVYTPYMKVWSDKYRHQPPDFFSSEKLMDRFLETDFEKIPSLSALGFKESNTKVPDPDLTSPTLKNYHEKRNFPAENATTFAGPHLRFGTISIRKLIAKAISLNETYLQELVWREFFMQVLYHFPRVVDHNFKSKYDQIEWINNEKDFEKWCRGLTGFPLVDAGMRQLNKTGYMHNRVRMITASFLTKHLLTDWRWGEAYFAEKLLDYELSSNNGNWQWAAGTGCDAVPYFRVFNPEEQRKKFDPHHKYVKKWIPEIGTNKYPNPVIDHKEGRERALKAYKTAVQS